ncbi:MAG TPA: rubredoxin [Bacteroidales bacterium]|nr:rubredoxin [Bacteroidales bacterium]
MEKYKCTICGYIYDPEQGDPVGGVDPNTPFGEVHDEWLCPICSAGKNEFDLVY